MKAVYLQSDRVADFITYCKKHKHKNEIDDSYLYDEDLRDFEPNTENPTYIVTNQQGDIVAAASIIINDYHKRGKKARFRIFHSEVNQMNYYQMLLQALLNHTQGLDKLFIFVPVENENLEHIIQKLKFSVERYSFLLIREDFMVPEFSLPENYEIRPFRVGTDEETWCKIRNEAFSKLQGSETPITPEMVTKMLSEEDYIEGGLMILFHKEKPVGVIRSSADEYETAPIMNIGPIAIIPEYQGRGLGRSLLRKALLFAKEKSLNRTVLCVNAENERAKALYIQEGFIQVEAVACYQHNLE